MRPKINRLASLASLACFAAVVGGCSWGAPPNERRGPVLPLAEGGYLFSFKRANVDVLSPQRPAAVELYLRSSQLMPAECKDGISVLKSGDTENGNRLGHLHLSIVKEMPMVPGVTHNLSIDTDPQQQEAASPRMLVVRSFLR